MLAVRQRCRRVMEIYREAREQKGQVLVKLSDSYPSLVRTRDANSFPWPPRNMLAQGWRQGWN